MLKDFILFRRPLFEEESTRQEISNPVEFIALTMVEKACGAGTQTETRAVAVIRASRTPLSVKIVRSPGRVRELLSAS